MTTTTPSPNHLLTVPHTPTTTTTSSTPNSTPDRPPHTHIPRAPSSPRLFQSLESYPWHADPSFLDGLSAILGTSSSSSSFRVPLGSADLDPDRADSGPGGGDEGSRPSPETRNGDIGRKQDGEAHPRQEVNEEEQPDQRTTDLTLRARCFYYTRAFDQQIDYDAYVAWRAEQPRETLSSLATPTSAGGDEASPSPSPSPSPLPRSHAATDSPTAEVTMNPRPAYPPTFTEVMHLIQTNQPVPGIREIPDTVLEGQGTEARMGARKKPWEVDKEGIGERGVGGAGLG